MIFRHLSTAWQFERDFLKQMKLGPLVEVFQAENLK